MATSRTSSLTKLRENLAKLDTNQTDSDNRYWKLGKDKAGNGMAIIRFLPEITDDDMPVVKYFEHWFQNEENGRWLKEMCPTSPTSQNKRCPICESNKTLYEGSEEDIKVARKRKRKLHYVANIYIVEDPVNPENNGKVFLFNFGASIYNRLLDKINPKFESETPLNVFDLVEGAAFKLKGAYKSDKGKKEEYSYDASEFMPIEDFTEMPNIDEILAARHDLMELIDPSLFKPYDDLVEILDKTLSGKVYKRKEQLDGEADQDEKDLEEALKVAQAKKAAKKANVEKEKAKVAEETDDDDDVNEDYLAKLEALSK